MKQNTQGPILRVSFIILLISFIHSAFNSSTNDFIEVNLDKKLVEGPHPLLRFMNNSLDDNSSKLRSQIIIYI